MKLKAVSIMKQLFFVVIFAQYVLISKTFGAKYNTKNIIIIYWKNSKNVV